MTRRPSPVNFPGVFGRLPSFVVALVVLAGAASCGGEGETTPVHLAFADRPPPSTLGTSVAFRFAGARGVGVRLYRLPDLEEVAWRFQLPDLVAERIAGFAPDEDLIYIESGGGRLVALDLASGRARTLDTLSARTVMGPTQTLFTVRADRTVGRVRDRRLDLWPDTLPAIPTDAWGTTAGRLVAVFETDEGRFLTLLSEDGAAGEPVPIPEGIVTAASWGDLVVVSADSALVPVSPTGEDVPGAMTLASRATALAFSPSAHRLYAATAAGALLVIDRFEFRTLFQRALPRPVETIRIDPMGRYLLLRPVGADSVMVYDAGDAEFLSGVAGEWGPDLPAVGVDGTLVVRRRDSVVAIDPSTGRRVGAAAGVQAGPWLLVAWDPRRPTLQLAVDRSADEDVEEAADDLLYYAQLSSTSNLDWANDRVRELREAGIEARVLLPSEWEDRYRVVLGPYPNRQEADRSGRRLGQAYFVISTSPSDSTGVR